MKPLRNLFACKLHANSSGTILDSARFLHLRVLTQAQAYNQHQSTFNDFQISYATLGYLAPPVTDGKRVTGNCLPAEKVRGETSGGEGCFLLLLDIFFFIKLPTPCLLTTQSHLYPLNSSVHIPIDPRAVQISYRSVVGLESIEHTQVIVKLPPHGKYCATPKYTSDTNFCTSVQNIVPGHKSPKSLNNSEKMVNFWTFGGTKYCTIWANS